MPAICILISILFLKKLSFYLKEGKKIKSMNAKGVCTLNIHFCIILVRVFVLLQNRLSNINYILMFWRITGWVGKLTQVFWVICRKGVNNGGWVLNKTSTPKTGTSPLAKWAFNKTWLPIDHFTRCKQHWSRSTSCFSL